MKKKKSAPHMPLLLFLLILPLTLGYVLFSLDNAGGSQANPGKVVTTSYREGEILVKFRKRLSAGEIMAAFPDLELTVVKEFEFFSSQENKSVALVRAQDRSVNELLNIFAGKPEVEAVSPNFRHKLCAVPNDPNWNKLWNLVKIAAPEAWDLTVGSPGVVVGVIDSGIDYNHEDISPNMWRNPGEIAGNGIDDDHNGYTDDYYGFDFAANNQGANAADPMDIAEHGTHVAGIIAAAGNNAKGICGVSWNTQTMSLKFVRPNGNLYDADAMEAIEYATMMKTRFNVNIVALNASWGGGSYNSLMEDAIGEAEKGGIIFVAAAGNAEEGQSAANLDQKPFYPACYPNANVVAVAASDSSDELADFSNWGPTQVDVAAPGVGIYSTVPYGKVAASNVVLGSDSLEAFPLKYSGAIPATGITGPIIDCGKGLVASDFPPAVSGKIALIERGETYFRDKVTLAQNAGAAAAVIFNNQSGNFYGRLCEDTDIDCQKSAWIPALAISQADGQRLKSSLPATVTLISSFSLYSYLDGTSMAAPHVSGTLALLAAYHPKENYRQRIGRILAGCDAPTGLAGKINAGRLNAWKSLKLGVTVSLYASRKTGSGWMVQRDGGWISLTLEQEQISQISGGKLVVERREGSSDFSDIKSIVPADLKNGSYEFLDKYLETGKKYTYRVQVFNAKNEFAGSSNQQTI